MPFYVDDIGIYTMLGRPKKKNFTKSTRLGQNHCRSTRNQGAECEYRHSEGARMNRNLKCLFGHPPLDGLLGTPSTPSVSAFSTEAPSIAQASVTHATAMHNLNRQSIPCYYFKKGICLKGDKCPFMHGPPLLTLFHSRCQRLLHHLLKIHRHVKVKRTFWSLDKCTSQQSIPKAKVDPPAIVVVSAAKPFQKAESIPANDLTVKSNLVHAQMDGELPPRSLPSNISIGSSNGRPQSHHS